MKTCLKKSNQNKLKIIDSQVDGMLWWTSNRYILTTKTILMMVKISSAKIVLYNDNIDFIALLHVALRTETLTTFC